MASSDLKSFYRNKKKAPAASKPYPSSKKRGGGGGASATLGAGAAQAPALVAHGAFDLTDEFGAEEEMLRQFDMDMRYGPCIGVTRKERWDRAAAMGLDPPEGIGALLREKPGMGCLWEGRV